MPGRSRPVLFFFNDTATTEIYTLSLHDALPILHALPDGEAFDLALRYAELELECVGAAQRHHQVSPLETRPQPLFGSGSEHHAGHGRAHGGRRELRVE